MIDTNLIKADPNSVVEQLKLRHYDFNSTTFEALEVDRKKFQTETEELQAQRNALSKDYGLLKKEGKDDSALNKKIESIKKDLDLCSKKLGAIQENLRDFLLDVPNLPDSSVPCGENEENNIKVRDFGEPIISGGKDHLDITSMIDIESANL